MLAELLQPSAHHFQALLLDALVFCVFCSDHPLRMPFITTRADHRVLKTLLIGAVLKCLQLCFEELLSLLLDLSNNFRIAIQKVSPSSGGQLYPL
ncbi:hypothetical protein SynBIOSE41_02116 [Synechococcus sp. BIOS-E4-1]|nr:hypothetical protein SynBIOSE41_02116 [Synechococcus sp. BIOS-E4-1]